MNCGTIIVIPLLNIYGFINFNRYVPDGKDVNRSFPGSNSGSLASRIARTLTRHILPHVNYIFDFHTGGDSRYNYPQVRYTRTDTVAGQLASVFNAPYLIETSIIPKSLRKTAREMKIPILVYEAGESVRLDGLSIMHGLQGLTSCLIHLGVLDQKLASGYKVTSILIKRTSWVRATYSGIFIWTKSSGTKVRKGEKLGFISDPNGLRSIAVISNKSGHIIGHNNASVVNQGDALFHIGYETSDIK
jgi:predicted deacylase